MRIFCYSTIIGFFTLALANVANAESLIYGFNEITVSPKLTTEVKFDQDELKKFAKTDNLKLRVMDGDKEIRTDAILNKEGVWVWDKILPFSDNLKLTILKDDKPISIEYAADNKSQLITATNNESLPLIRGVYTLPAIKKPSDKKTNITIEFPKALKDCKANILAVVFNKNKLLWQYFGQPKDDLTTGKIDYADGLQTQIITDEDSCVK
jgi:hypothetical protein